MPSNPKDPLQAKTKTKAKDNGKNALNSDTGIDTWDGLDRLHEIIQNRANKYVQDLYRKKEHLEEHAGVLTAILESLGEALIVMDPDGKVVLCNNAAEVLTNLELRELTQAKWAQMSKSYMPGSNKPLAYEELPGYKARHGEASTKTMLVYTEEFPQGRWLRVNASPVRDKSNKVHGAVCVIQDLTETKRLIQQRDALAALVTHDLKNHIVAETRLFEMLLDGSCGELNAQQEELLKLLEADSRQQLCMLTNMMEIYRYDVGSETLRFEDLDLSDYLATALKQMQPAATAGELKLEQDIAPELHHISGDPRALKHVFLNLLGNSIKFTPAGGKIKLKARNEDNAVVVTISDTGKGIPEDELRVLFNDAWSESATHKPIGSTGLGLFICRRLLDAHKATIACKSKVNSGTTFTITFKL